VLQFTSNYFFFLIYNENMALLTTIILCFWTNFTCTFEEKNQEISTAQLFFLDKMSLHCFNLFFHVPCQMWSAHSNCFQTRWKNWVIYSTYVLDAKENGENRDLNNHTKKNYYHITCLNQIMISTRHKQSSSEAYDAKSISYWSHLLIS
jgi:hypothetical protein